MQHLCIRRLKVWKWIYPVPYLSRKSIRPTVCSGEERGLTSWTAAGNRAYHDKGWSGLEIWILADFEIIIKSCVSSPFYYYMLNCLGWGLLGSDSCYLSILLPKLPRNFHKQFYTRSTDCTVTANHLLYARPLVHRLYILSLTPHFLLKFFLCVVYLGYFITIVYKKL